MAYPINLKILSDDPKIHSICTRYWSINAQGEFTEANTKLICQDFDLNNHQLTKIIKENTIVTSELFRCDNCDEPQKITSRTQYLANIKKQSGFGYRNNICTTCKDEARQKAIALAELEQIKTKDRHLLARDELIKVNASRAPFSIKYLDFRELVFLKTLLDHSGSETLDSINPYGDNPTLRVAPGDIPETIISELKDKNIILVDPESALGTYFLNENEQLTYYPTSVNYKINFDIDLYTKGSGFYKAITDLLGSPDFFKSHIEDFLALSEQIMVQSLLEFMLWMIDDHNLVFSAGEKTILVLQELVQALSISQGMNVIYGAVKNAAAYAMKDNISRNQAANSVVGSIQRRVERILQENWDPKKFNRNYELPQTTLERVLYSKIFEGNDTAFDLSLNQQTQMLNESNE